MSDDYLAVIEEQYKLPWEDRRKLISFEGSATLNETGVDFATAIARQYQLPVSCIALIATKQGLRPYVTADGMLFRLHHDSRGPVTITTEMLDWGDVTKKARVRATVTIGGSTYTGHAQVSLDGKGDPDNNLMRAECVPLRSEILTKVGFLRHDEVLIGDLVVAYDAEAGVTRWTPLLAKTVFPATETVRISNKGEWRFDCTPDHRWPLERAHDGRRSLEPIVPERSNYRIVCAAACVSGPVVDLTEREAAIIGWLATDGSMYKNKGGDFTRAVIFQSKEHVLPVLRELCGDDATEIVSKPTVRTFPGGSTYACLPQHLFQFKAAWTRALMQRAHIAYDLREELPSLVTNISSEARRAMLQAMLLADGDVSHRFTKSKGRVFEAFQILCVLEGIRLGKPACWHGYPSQKAFSERPYAYTLYLHAESLGKQPVWCPTTEFGTWVMRQDNYVCITGNTKSVRRACMRAVGIPFPVYEEAREYADTAYDDVRPARQGSVQADFKVVDGPVNRVEFMAEASKLGFSSERAILDAMGISSIEEIYGNYAAALELLKELV